MKGLLILGFCAVYTVQAWRQDIGPLHIDAKTGILSPKYNPLTGDDKHATRKAAAFVNFIKFVPQVNPLKIPSLGPYNIALPDVNFQGKLQLTNVVVNGLKYLNLAGLELRMTPARIDFNASIPQVSVEVSFELQSVLAGQPINVNGQLSGAVKDLSLSAAVTPKVEQVYSSQVYQVSSADASIDLKGLTLAMEMNQYAEDFRTILIQFLQNTKQYAPIVEDLLKAVLRAINKELTQITAKEILQYLLGKSRPSLSG